MALFFMNTEGNYVSVSIKDILHLLSDLVAYLFWLSMTQTTIGAELYDVTDPGL